MVAKVPKCFCLGIRASSAKRFDSKLRLGDQPIPFIEEQSIKFLDGPISVPVRKRDHQRKLVEKVSQLFEKVDNTSVSMKQKLLLYKAGICPRLTWDLAIPELPCSWIFTESGYYRFLKKWSGLARPANTALLYLPKVDGGLGLPALSLLYQKLRISQAALLMSSRDRLIQQVVRKELEREEVQ